MIVTNVQFSFNTKEEWIEFYKYFTMHKLFVRYSPMCKKMNEHYADFESAVIHFFDKLEKPWFLDSMVFIETKSAKLLKSLNEFIKEHHYENNYTLRDNWGNRMKTDIDGLLEWWESQTKVKEVA